MSSILDALRKIEEAETRPTGQPRTHEPPRRTFVLVAGGIVAAFIAGVGATLWLRAGTAPAPVQTAAVTPATVPAVVPAPAPRPAPAPPAAVQAPPATAAAPEAPPSPPAAAAPAPAPAPVELAPVPPAPPPPRAMVEAEPPRAHLTDIPPPPVHEPTAEPQLARRSEPVAEPPPPRQPERVAEPPPAQPVEDVVSTRPPAGAPQVFVNFLAWSRVAERRTVTLTIGDAGMVTLHEGETAADVEVVRILADRVHVRYTGQLYAVKAVP